jgi:hypothetical protein
MVDIYRRLRQKLRSKIYSDETGGLLNYLTLEIKEPEI